jgi:hypothetical protein
MIETGTILDRIVAEDDYFFAARQTAENLDLAGVGVAVLMGFGLGVRAWRNLRELARLEPAGQTAA